MSSLFNYKTLSTRLEQATRTLVITLNDQENFNHISMEMLFELESVLSWSTTKVEVHSILIDSSTSYFSHGIDLEHCRNLNRQTLEKFFDKLQKINLALFHLPQTVVIDLGDGAEGVASELAIGADIRVCSVNTEIQFNHTHHGLVPCSGGMGFLSTVISPAMARNWVLTGTIISQEQLAQSGFIHDFYDSTNKADKLNTLLSGIRAQAPIQRIQAKLGLLEGMRARLEHATHYERQIAKAALIPEDWKTFNRKDDNFMPAKSMGEVVKLTLVKDEEEQKLPNNVTPIN